MALRFQVRAALFASAIFVANVALLRAQDPENEFTILLQDAQKTLTKGELRSAENSFQEILDAREEANESDRPTAAVLLSARAGVLAIELRRGLYQQVIDTIRDLPEQEQQRRDLRALLARALRAVGQYEAAAAFWQEIRTKEPADLEARYELGEIEWAMGKRKNARAIWSEAGKLPAPTDALQLTHQARCRWRLGGPEEVMAASADLVRSLELQPDLWLARMTLGILRFQVYGEARGFPSGERDLNTVLEKHGDVEEALLWLYRLRSSNFVLDGGKTERLLERVLGQNPRSVAAIVQRGARVLDDRRYQDAGEVLDQALAVDGRDKDALAHRAAVAWLLHDEEDYAKWRERALVGDEKQPDVDRVLGEHLVALYRFADSIPFFEAALSAEPDDVPSLHGLAKALIYTGQGARAKEVLLRAKAKDAGYVDPWRTNALAVQQLLDEQYDRVENERFVVSVHRDDRNVMLEYLMPLCLEAFSTLGSKYQYQPDRKVAVEVFHTWDDFSVRTIGFRGFTALGACFGPFLTLVSPGDTDLRKQDFMWEATVWHEYAHVLTLGVSKHRVPRWLTEGFSVHEEKERDRTFERGMDRELFDAFHNRDIPPVRLLNRLFRGERILFGYYQGGLIVDLIARDFGFAKAIELLRAFGDDLDNEAAFQRALGISSATFDQQFLEFVDKEKLRGMKLVPHFDDAAVHRLLTRATKEPSDLQVRIDLAWAFVQRRNPVDAGPHLALVLQREPDNGRALLVRASLLAMRNSMPEALEAWTRGFAAGADDFDSRIAFGRALLATGDEEGAERQFQSAKACWPNCTEQDNAPELLLARLYRETDRRESSLLELKSYCRRTARAYAPRWLLAEFEREAGNREAELRYLEECNRIDPFRREQHVRMGDALVKLGRAPEAAREYEVAAAVSPVLDRKYTARGAERPATEEPGEREERGELLLLAARLRAEGREFERARALATRVVAELPATKAADEARALLLEWQDR